MSHYVIPTTTGRYVLSEGEGRSLDRRSLC